jgi:hypothetical protein
MEDVMEGELRTGKAPPMVSELVSELKSDRSGRPIGRWTKVYRPTE